MINITCFMADTGGCGFYRVLQPFFALGQTEKYKTTITNAITQKNVDESDVLIFQRQHSDGMLKYFNYAKQIGKVTIYELDDLLHLMPGYNPFSLAYPQNSPQLKRAIYLIKESDGFIASTQAMKDEYFQYNKNIEIIRNVINTDVFPKNEINEGNEIRIGWAGSSTHTDDIKLIVCALKEILDKYSHVKLVFIGFNYGVLLGNKYIDRYEFLQNTFRKENNEENINCVFDYYKLLANAKLDIGIAPLVKNRFNACKSDVKAIEYGALGLPCVLSDSPEYKYYHENSNGACFISEKHKNWVKNLSLLIENKELRKDMGDKGKDYVFNNRSVKSVLNQYDDFIIKLIKKKECLKNG